jgi:hypothetical protein
MRIDQWLGVGLALAVAGCAAAMPGYIPPDSRSDKIRALAPKGGGFDEAGTYSLTEQEQKLDCKQLTGSVRIKILQLRETGARKAPSAVAAQAQQITRDVKYGGSSYGIDLARDRREDLARLETLNRQLAAKNCKSFDLEAQLRPGNTATPTPAIPAKR